MVSCVGPVSLFRWGLCLIQVYGPAPGGGAAKTYLRSPLFLSVLWPRTRAEFSRNQYTCDANK